MERFGKCLRNAVEALSDSPVVRFSYLIDCAANLWRRHRLATRCVRCVRKMRNILRRKWRFTVVVKDGIKKFSHWFETITQLGLHTPIENFWLGGVSPCQQVPRDAMFARPLMEILRSCDPEQNVTKSEVFSASAPLIWKSLSTNVHDVSISMNDFSTRLEAELFRRVYETVLVPLCYPQKDCANTNLTYLFTDLLTEILSTWNFILLLLLLGYLDMDTNWLLLQVQPWWQHDFMEKTAAMRGGVDNDWVNKLTKYDYTHVHIILP